MDPRLGRSRNPQTSPVAPAELRQFYAQPPLATRNLSLHALGVREWMRPGVVDRPNGTGDWLLMVFHQPVRLAAGAAPGPAPCLMLWRPGDPHFYGREDIAWNHSWMHFDGACVRRHVGTCGLRSGEPIAPVDPLVVERAIGDIHLELQAHAAPDEVIVENLLHNLLRTVARAARGAQPAIPSAYLAVRRHLEASFAEPCSLDELARMAGCSVGHFCGRFKRWFGVSAIDYVISLRMQRARMLLADRNRSVAQVAREVGYADLHHFSKLFRKRHGCPPSALRGRVAT